MKKLSLILLAAVLLLAGFQSSNAQVNWGVPVSFGGHTYIPIPPCTRIEAVQAAVSLGGYICKLETNEEFYFIDSTFVKRGTGWWWTSVTAHADANGNLFWANDDLTGLSNVYGIHWNPNQYTTPADEGSYIVMAKFQIVPRSTKWITKFGNFSKSFGDGMPKPAIIEIDPIPVTPLIDHVVAPIEQVSAQ
jgi:hypothetical protein